MVNVTCIDQKCGVPFGIPEHIHEQAKRDSARSVICPNGHSFVYRTSDPDRLRARISELETEVGQWKQQTSIEEGRTALAYRRVAYWKGVATRERGRR
jgi:hypothetical protein